MACGAELGDAATRCPSCGLALRTDGPAIVTAGSTDPLHVGLYLGSVPTVVPVSVSDTAAADDAAPAERETPPAAPQRMPVRNPRRLVLVALVVGLAAAALLVAIVASRRPRDRYDLQEEAFARFARSAQLAPVEPPVVPAPEEEDALPGREVLRVARRTHRPLAPAPGATLHEFFDVCLARLVEVEPAWAIHSGLRPRPVIPWAQRPAAGAESRLLCRDVSDALHAWPGVERLSPHDRADRAAWLAVTDAVLTWRSTPELGALDDLTDWLYRAQHLRDVHAWPVEDRIVAATSILDDLPASLGGATDELKSPPRARVVDTAEMLDAADRFLAAYAVGWDGAADASMQRLRSAVAKAREASARCASRLRAEFLTGADGALGIGRENVATILRRRHALPDDTRTLYAAALQELREAHDVMRPLWPALRGQAGSVRAVADDVEVRGLRTACADWVPSMPADERIVVRVLPDVFLLEASATYEDSGASDPSEPGVVHISAAVDAGDGVNRGYERLRRRHTLAHETYPGHRMESVLRRDACALRRFVDDRVFVEGWAAYAEELLHETGHCDGGPADEFVRASARADKAVATMFTLLVETGAASGRDVAELMRLLGWESAGPDDAARWSSSSLQFLDYSVGAAEIRHLRVFEEQRLGSAFDLRAFHAKLLSEGPIPPRLIEEEWRESAR